MHAGRMDRRITLYRRETTQGQSGQEIITWVTVLTVWAEWRPLRAGERWAAQQVVPMAEGQFRIRWREGLTPLHALRWRDERYDINGVEEIGRRDGIVLHVSRRVTDDF